MSKIRDSAKEQIYNIIYSYHGPCCNGSEEQCKEMAHSILSSIPEIAVVNRKVNLPYPQYSPILTMDNSYDRGHELGYKCGVIDTLNEFVNGNYVKEVK